MSTFRKVGTVDEVPDGSQKAFKVGESIVLVCQVFGKFYAMRDLCTHASVPLSTGPLIGKEIHCPLHGARFDVTNGKALCPPARRDADTTEIEVRGDEIWVKELEPA